MANTKKITKAKKYEDIIAILRGTPSADSISTEQAIEFLEYEKDLVSKKNSSVSKKQAKTQEENNKYKDIIVSYLKENGKRTVSELIKEINELKEFSNQKVTNLVTDLKNAGIVTNTKEKGKSYFSVGE